MDEPNVLLDTLLEEAGISYSGLASRINTLTAATRRRTRYDHTAVSRWIKDHATPRGNVPNLICEIVGAKLHRSLTLSDIGMDRRHNQPHSGVPLECAVDQTTALIRGDLRRTAFLGNVPVVEGAAAIVPVFEPESTDQVLGFADLIIVIDGR